jgi:flagellar hook-associated protein FlgK
MNRDGTEVLLQDLRTQRSDISGVDINDEAAQLLVFQQMFQAIAKYLGVIQSSLSTVMEIV